MPDYTFSVGTLDPSGFAAATDQDAISYAVGLVMARHADDLKDRPQEVVTLMGATGLLTRPSERIDEFVTRLEGRNPVTDPSVFQPGDTNSPDCNGD